MVPLLLLIHVLNIHYQLYGTWEGWFVLFDEKQPKTATNREGVVLFDEKRNKDRDQERESSVYYYKIVDN
jgi:hypothetical protein